MLTPMALIPILLSLPKFDQVHDMLLFCLLSLEYPIIHLSASYLVLSDEISRGGIHSFLVYLYG